MVVWPQLERGGEGVGHFVVGTTQKYHFFDAAPNTAVWCDKYSAEGLLQALAPIQEDQSI